MANTIKTDLVVLGSGPGGYSAAFRASDLGLQTVLIERYENIGGVCLNVGCIPSKALLHAAKVIDDAEEMREFGIEFGKPKIDTYKLRDWKNKVVGKLTGGLKAMAKQRKVGIVTGIGEFISSHAIKVNTNAGEVVVEFQQAIIAAGSRPVQLPFIPHDDKRVLDSTSALELENTQCKMLVLGGGIIGCEMATVYRAFGAEITIVELMDQLMPGADNDLVTIYHKRVKNLYKNIYLKTKVTKVEAKKEGLYVTFEGEGAPDKPEKFDRVLVAVGRRPNTDLIAAEKAGVKVNERGLIPVDKQMRTNVAHIFAIGDIVGQPMLAHKASSEGRLAAEVAAGKKHYFDAKCIPAVAYTDPEVAWVGLTENEAREKNIAYEKAAFPWAASGRSLAMNRSEGMTKLIFDPKTHRLLGAGIVGTNAGELISETALAIEMGAEAEDIALTIHPHPTLSESVMMSSEIFEGTITDLYMPKKKKETEKA